LVINVIVLVAERQRNGAGADQSEFALWANEKLLKIGGKIVTCPKRLGEETHSVFIHLSIAPQLWEKILMLAFARKLGYTP